MKSMAAVLERLNFPLTLMELEVPPLVCGQVLVKIHCSSICGAQIGEISGAKGVDKYLPHLLGHEGSGVIVDVGPGVSHVHIGDHVVMHWRKGIGIEASPPRYAHKNSIVGAGPIATFCEYSIVSENRVSSIPNDIAFDIASLMGCAVTTALGLINNEAQLKIGQSIAVFGCGGIGLNVIQGASLVSANPIIAIDMNELKLRAASSMGATHTINTSTENIQTEIQRIIRDVDVAVECTGHVSLIEMAYQVTRPHGRTIMVGQPHHSQCLTIPFMRQHFTGKTLLDSEGGHTNPSVDIPRYIALYQTGKLQLNPIITDRVSFRDINVALDKMRKGEVIGRCVLFHGEN